MKKCAKLKKGGKPCKAYTQSNSDYCFTHDPHARAIEDGLGKLGITTVGRMCPVSSQQIVTTLQLKG